MCLSRRQDHVQLRVVLQLIDGDSHDTGDEATQEGDGEIDDLGVSIDQGDTVAAVERALVPDHLGDLLGPHGQLVPRDGRDFLALVVEHPVGGELGGGAAAVPENGGNVVKVGHGRVLVVWVVDGKGNLARLERHLELEGVWRRQVTGREHWRGHCGCGGKGIAGRVPVRPPILSRGGRVV